MLKIGCCEFPVRREEYLGRFRVVEVQETFYQPPRPETARRWRREARLTFEFSLKAWQLITHEASSPTYRRLKRSLTAAERRQAGAFRDSPLVRRPGRRPGRWPGFFRPTSSCSSVLPAAAPARKI